MDILEEFKLMEKSFEVILIVSKIMNEEIQNKNKLEIIYDNIYNLLFKNLSNELDEMKYPFVAYTTQKLNKIMQNFEIYNKFPFLLEKNILRVSSENNLLMSFLFPFEKELDVIKKNRNLPMFVFKGNEKKFYVINYINKIIEISEKEYQKIQFLYQNDIEIRKLIKSYIYETPNYLYDNLVSVIVPKYCRRESEEYIEKLKKYTVDENNIMKYFEQNKRFQEIFEKLNKKTINFNLSIKLENILLDIEYFYLISVNKKKEQLELLTKNLIEMDQESKLQKEVKEYKKEIVSKIEKIESFYKKFKEIEFEILDDSKKYEKEVSDTLLHQLENNTESNLYIEDLLDNFFKLLEMSKFLQLKDCILKLKMANYGYISELEIIYKILQKKVVEPNEIFKIKNICEKNYEFSKLKMILSKELGYSDKELVEIVSNIPLKWHKGKENFYLGKKAYNEGKYDEAEKKYRKSLELGYLEAGIELIINLRRDKNYDYNIEKLANYLIPEANYIVGMKSLSEKKYKKGVVYLKMASSKNHLKAIEKIADLLFDKYKKMSWREVIFTEDENKKIKENRKNINNVINLYEYLSKHKSDAKYFERMGLLLCKIGAYREGLGKLRDVDSYEAIYQCGRIYLHGENVAQDLEKAKFYFEKIINREVNTNDLYLKRLKEKVQEDYKKTCDWIKNKEKRPKSYVTRTSYRSTGSSSCCYIITATCMALGIKRDKKFLDTLVEFRNSYLKEKNGKKHILEYYRISPKIAEIIDKEWNPFITYKELWEDYINLSIEEMKKNNWNKAKQIYNLMLKKLCKYYSIRVRSSVAQEYGIKI
jgi:hypothetical protein